MAPPLEESWPSCPRPLLAQRRPCASEPPRLPLAGALNHSDIATASGIDRATFDRATADQGYLDKLNAATDEANQKFGVEGTQSFFVNDELIEIKRSSQEVSDAHCAAKGL